MTRTIIYYERGKMRDGTESISVRSDEINHTIDILKRKHHDLMCVYKKSDTRNGLPLIVLWER